MTEVGSVATAFIRLEGLTHTYRLGNEEVRAVDDLSLEIAAGESASLVGPSGSGKSTLMHILGGLLTPQKGRVVIDGQDLGRLSDRELSRFRNRTLGFIFQSFHLQPDATALENVEVPLIFSGVARKERRALAAEALEAVGLSPRARHRPSQLSGGEMQRVAIARAIVTRPRLLLADEPTGNLDGKNGESVVQLLLQLHRERQMTLIVVTHNEKLAARMGRVFAMEEGRIGHGTP